MLRQLLDRRDAVLLVLAGAAQALDAAVAQVGDQVVAAVRRGLVVVAAGQEDEAGNGTEMLCSFGNLAIE